MRLFKIFPLILLLVFCLVEPVSAKEKPIKDKGDKVDKVSLLKKGVVNVKVNVIKSAYNLKGEYFGSGFLVDKKLGLVLTNAHIAKSSELQELLLTFFNGKEVPAKLIYQDPWQDLSVLKIDPAELPHDCVELELADYEPKTEQKILIIGNNQNNNFSVQEGVINSLYNSASFFPGQHLAISVNVKGGASGSPIFDERGQVIGIVFGGSETFVNGLPVQYINDILFTLKNNKTPNRKDTGAILGFRSLDRLVKFYNFPKKVADDYIIKNPSYMNLALTVKGSLANSPAAKLLNPGDIIWKINGKEIGANLYLLQKIINEAGDKINLTIYRNGQKQELEINLYDLNKAKLKRMLLVADTVFFEVDDVMRLVSGAPLGAVLVKNIEQGSSFDVFPYGGFQNFGYMPLAQILNIDNQTINSLDDIAKIIPNLMAKKHFSISYKNLVSYSGYDYWPMLSKSIMSAEVTYNSYGTQPVLLEFDDNTLEWKSNFILNQDNIEQK
ncbi:MAG: S1C family serine protease [Candidatus Midichloria sp.]|nr:S1C family serine protease [Candidatus Midichloria sp.]